MKILWYGILAAGVVIFDRLTKLWALTSCVYPQIYNAYVSCTLTFNRGVSWGMFHSQNTCIFTTVSLVIIAITLGLFLYAYRQYKEGHGIVGEILIIAGSCSNIYDRIMYKGVIDFIELSYDQWLWPSFNIADCCIVVGVGIMLWQQIFSDK